MEFQEAQGKPHCVVCALQPGPRWFNGGVIWYIKHLNMIELKSICVTELLLATLGCEYAVSCGEALHIYTINKQLSGHETYAIGISLHTSVEHLLSNILKIPFTQKKG